MQSNELQFYKLLMQFVINNKKENPKLSKSPPYGIIKK